MHFERAFRGLSPDERVAFVVDLWSARGYETASDGAAVVATDPETGVETRLVVLHGGGTEAPAGADVLVAPSTRAHQRIDRSDARVHGPQDLQEMLLYAVERDRGDALAQRYFGRPLDRVLPSDQRAAGSQATGWHLRTVPPRVVPGSVVPTARVRMVLVVAVATVCLAGGILGAAGPVPPVADSGAVVADETRQQPATTGVRGGYPPGLDAGGVDNLTRLVHHHRDALAAGPYQVVVRHNWSRGALLTTGRWVDATQMLEVRTDRSYLRVVGTRPPATVGETPRSYSLLERRNASGCVRYSTVERGEGEMAPACDVLETGDAGERFGRLTGTYVRRYLDASEVTVQAVRSDQGSWYRVVATGTPARINADVSGYRAVAVVEPSGLVVSLEVRYTWQHRVDPREVQFVFRVIDRGGGAS